MRCTPPYSLFVNLDVEPAQPPSRGQWSPNLLALLLAGLLGGSLVLSGVLWFELGRLRAQVEQAEANAVKPAPPPPAPVERVAAAVVPEPAPEPAVEAAPPPQRLIILLTVGTRHFAEKQLRLLRQRCNAPLGIYLQRHGRCAFSQCFAVAVREADANLARDCGETSGEALRDSGDFTELQ